MDDKRVVVYTGPKPEPGTSNNQLQLAKADQQKQRGTQTNAVVPVPTPYKGPYDCKRCGAVVFLERNDPIVCHRCEHRMLYKQKNTGNLPVHDAR